jgi:hypothetical protein
MPGVVSYPMHLAYMNWPMPSSLVKLHHIQLKLEILHTLRLESLKLVSQPLHKFLVNLATSNPVSGSVNVASNALA